MKAGLQIVRTPAQAAAHYHLHGDRSRSAAQAEALHAAHLNGRELGERVGYVQGWRWGFAGGAIVASVGSAAALFVLRALGWL